MPPWKIVFHGGTIFWYLTYNELNTFKVKGPMPVTWMKGGWRMRGRRGRRNRGLGMLAITAGIVILLAMVLPVGFWWFALAVLLISLGIWYNHCR